MAGSVAVSRLIWLAGTVGLVRPAALGAQAPPDDVRQRILQVYATVSRFGQELSDSLWPGFRPDTIPILYVLPGQGTLLLGWRGPLPAEFAALTSTSAGWRPAAERGAASTGTMLGGRGTAQVVVRDTSAAALIGLSLHEAFHVHASASAAPGRRFGQGENSFLVGSYPVFDAENEAGMALEGRLLAAALESADSSRQRALARRFIAARESRHRRLDPSYAEFEQLAELNEGLAEYQLIKSAELALRAPASPDSAGARVIARRLPTDLRSLTVDARMSLRLRFYRLGPAQALLLDRLAGPEWKRGLLEHNRTLQDALAEAAGSRDEERALLAQAVRDFDAGQLKAAADQSVRTLRRLRQQQVDSLLSAPGLTVTVMFDSMPGRSISLCGIDPQNLLQVDEHRLLHTRWLRACRGAAFDATFNTATVQDNRAGTLQTVLRPGDPPRILVLGNPLTLDVGARHPGVTDLAIASVGLELRAARADLWRTGTGLFIRIRP